MLRFVKRLFNSLLVLLAALFIFIEEWLWEALKLLMVQIARLPVIRWIEVRIAGLTPYAAIAIFLLPGLLLLPVKLLALYAITKGHALLGRAAIISAKVMGAALVARIFTLTKPALLTVKWFARLYGWFLRFRGKIFAKLHAMPAWQQARLTMARIRSLLRRLFGSKKKSRLQKRWRAVHRYKRKKTTP